MDLSAPGVFNSKDKQKYTALRYICCIKFGSLLDVLEDNHCIVVGGERLQALEVILSEKGKYVR